MTQIKKYTLAGALALLVLFIVLWILDGIEYDRTVNDDPGVIYSQPTQP